MANNFEADIESKKLKKRKRKKLMREDIPKEPVQDVYRKAAKLDALKNK